MPSSYSVSLRLEEQFTGENVNTWGVRLNTVLSRVDFSIAGWTVVALTASRALTVSNTADDEARSGALKFTGTGAFTVTIPSVSKGYYLRNACTGIVTVTTGSGATVAIDPGDVVQVFCDGMDVTTLGYSGQSIKDWIAAVAFSYNAGNLPAMPGNAGKYIKTDGTNASWQIIQSTDIGDRVAREAEAQAYARAIAIAFSVAL